MIKLSSVLQLKMTLSTYLLLPFLLCSCLPTGPQSDKEKNNSPMDARDFSGHWVGSGTMRVSDTQVVEERCQMMTITIQQSVDLFKLSDIQFKCGEGEIIGSTISLVVRNGELFWGATPVGRIVGERVSLRYQHSSGEISARLELLPDGTLQFSEDSISDDITYSWTGILGRQ